MAQSTDALAPVGYPPPPARVEFVPVRPRPGAVWIDGEWIWQGHGWAWEAGRWVLPPGGWRYAPWTVVRGDDGSVYYAQGAWRDGAGHAVASPAPLAVAKTGTGPVVDPEGGREATGKLRRDSPESSRPP